MADRQTSQNHPTNTHWTAKVIPDWVTSYNSARLPADIIAGIVVGILVIPQSLGYAVLAGLPPVIGLYASIVPVLIYAWVGSSNVQAIGPVAITAIMTASSLHGMAVEGSIEYIMLASLLALMVGLMLWTAGKLKLGWIMQFISRGVSSGFVSGAAVLIFASQLKYLTNIAVSGNTLPGYTSSLFTQLNTFHLPTFIIGSIAFILFMVNRYASKLVWQSWLAESKAKWAGRLFPLVVVIIAIFLSHFGHWSTLGIRVIGEVPSGLPILSIPKFESNPAMSPFQHILGNAGKVIFGIVIWAASITSVIGAAYTSVSFMSSFHPFIERNKRSFIITFILISTFVFATIGKPAQLLVLAGTLNGLILPIAMIIILIAAYRTSIVGSYKHPIWIAIFGWIIALIMSGLSIMTIANYISG